MRNVVVILSVAGLAVSLAACNAGAAHSPSTSPSPSAPWSLASPLSLAANAPTSGSVRCTIAGGFADARPLTLPITQPLLVLHSDGKRATLDAFVLPLGDVDVPPSALPPDGLGLRDLALRLPAGTHADVIAADADGLALQTTAPLLLDWSLALPDGKQQPLGSIATAPLSLALRIARGTASDAGATMLTLHASCAGSCWSLPGIAELSDGTVDLQTSVAIGAAD